MQMQRYGSEADYGSDKARAKQNVSESTTKQNKIRRILTTRSINTAAIMDKENSLCENRRQMRRAGNQRL